MPYREIFANTTYHVYNRGTLKMPIFRERNDYERFLKKLFEYEDKYNVDILVYCLMPNHFHLLLKENEVRVREKTANISLFMQCLINAYTKYFSFKYKHSGVVFQSTYKSKIIGSEDYFLQLRDYILDNPVRKNLVHTADDWPWQGVLNVLEW